MSINEIALGMGVAIVLVAVGFLYRKWSYYAVANAEARQTSEIIRSVDRLLLALVKAESGQRSFLLSGEDRYLERYNRAIQSIPLELAQLTQLLAARPGQPGNVSRLNALVDQELSELGRTISLRQTRGTTPALDVLLSDESTRRMDEIRRIGSEIEASEGSVQNEGFREREAVPQITLLATIAGGLLLLFLFALSISPIKIRDSQVEKKSRLSAYGTAVMATFLATLLRTGLSPLVGDTAVPFITFFPAVLFSSWFGGLRAGSLSVLLSATAATYYFVAPVYTFHIANPGDQITLLIFIVVGIGMAILSHSQRHALERAARAEFAERTARQQFETTLASIGDGVITTDASGRIIFMNEVAESLTGWKQKEALTRSSEKVFQIVHEHTHQQLENPALRAISEGRIFGLANQTVLVGRDGAEIPIDYRGLRIKDPDGKILGAVLIFRDITQRRRLEDERKSAARTAQRLAAIVESTEDAIIATDLDLRITSWNLSAERIFGHSAKAAIAQSIRIIIPEDRWGEEDDVRRRIRRGEKIEHFETERRRKNSTLIPVSVTVSPIYDSTGTVVGASQIVRDITERKKGEERFRLAVEGYHPR